MYLTAVACLLHGARAILYDGSPFLPDLKAFVRLLGEQKYYNPLAIPFEQPPSHITTTANLPSPHRVTKLGISPRWLQTYASANLHPRDITDLSSLKGVTSTGMVLSESLFHYFYSHAFPAHTQLANISGGTDLAGCFGMENPLTPVYAGGTQGPSLGTAVEVYDSEIDGGKGVKGVALEDGKPGDLVATKSFPNMPVMFWGDKDGKKYFDAYFEKYDNVWVCPLSHIVLPSFHQ